MMYREMKIDDYDEVIALWKETEGVGLSSADSREAIAFYLGRNAGLSFVALLDEGEEHPGKIVGAVLCGHDGRRGYLHHLSVHPEYRKRGIGRSLVQICIAGLRSQGIDKCHIFVFTTNISGREFWKKLGWQERDHLVLMSTTI